MGTSEQIAQVIAALEAQRTVLGDAATDRLLATLRQQLPQPEPSPEAGPAESKKIGSEERRLVTVMFADISGFTAMSETLDPEMVRDALNACFRRLVPLVSQYGGTVDKFIGDEIMAVFGVPVMHEDDPERALAAALDMMAALAELNEERGLDLGMHFGINTGLVIAGGVGSDERSDYSVMGDAVNLAARLEDASERGEILVGPVTYRLTEKLFAFETRPPLRLKGKAEVVHAYRLLGRLQASMDQEKLSDRRVIFPLVGRDQELLELVDRAKSLASGLGGVISVLGDPGLGKSRIMAELREALPLQQDLARIRWLEGRCLSFGQVISYRPFQEILWQAAGITENSDRTGAWQRLEAVIQDMFRERTAEVLPYLASMVSLDVTDEYTDRVKYLDGEAMRRQIFFASRRFFEAWALQTPLLLVFEDLHWVDESSALLLEHLIPLAGRVPLLIVMVSRPDTGTPAIRLRELARRECADHYREIDLAPLTHHYSETLVRNLLDMNALPPQLQESILRRAEGNPFFLEEIIRSLIDLGKLAKDPATGAWQVADLGDITIPDTIQSLLMSRVDRLDEDVRRVLRTAAVIGRSFFYRVLSAVELADRQLDHHLTELQHQEFIRYKDGVPGAEYIFKHALAQQVTYEGILLKKRRRLHARVAESLEMLFSDRIDEICSLLANHYARAEVWDKAHYYLRKAGDCAGRLAADAEALASYRQALDAYQRAFGDTWDPLERASLERRMGEALFRQGDHIQALGYLRRALGYLEKPLPEGKWRVRLAIVREIVAQMGHRLRPGRGTEPSNSSVAPVLEEELRLYEVIGWIVVFEQYESFFLVALRGLNVSEHGGYSYGIARGLTALGLICDLCGLFRTASWYHRRAESVAGSIRHPSAIALAHTGLAVHHVCRAQWDLAHDHATGTTEICRETGELRCLGYGLYMQAVASAFQGKLGQALTQCREMVKIGEDGADRQVLCWGLTVQGHVLRLLGRFDAAEESLSRARDLAITINDHIMAMWTESEVARCSVRQVRTNEARAAWESGEQWLRRYSNVRLIWVALRNALAEGSLHEAQQGDNSGAPERLKAAAKAVREALKNGRRYRGLLPEAQRLRGTYEWLKGRPGKARTWWQRSMRLAEAAGQRHDLAEALREAGTRLNDPSLLLRADELRNELWLGETESSLSRPPGQSES
jgi:class 3 adenylate cyclase/tetratricopeptide (TPR) repeat protein